MLKTNSFKCNKLYFNTEQMTEQNFRQTNYEMNVTGRKVAIEAFFVMLECLLKLESILRGGSARD